MYQNLLPLFQSSYTDKLLNDSVCVIVYLLQLALTVYSNEYTNRTRPEVTQHFEGIMKVLQTLKVCLQQR